MYINNKYFYAKYASLKINSQKVYDAKSHPTLFVTQKLIKHY